MRARCVLFAVVALAGCDQPAWKGWAYPNRSDLTDDIPLGAFETLEECRASARSILARTELLRDEDGEAMKGDYECGYDCKPDGGPGGLNICEKTER